MSHSQVIEAAIREAQDASDRGLYDLARVSLRAARVASRKWQHEVRQTARLQQAARVTDPLDILQAVAVVFGVTQAEMSGDGRHETVVEARMVAVYLMREMTRLSFPGMTRAMGRRNHSTLVTQYQRLMQALTAGGPEAGRLRDRICAVRKMLAGVQ